MKNLRLRNLVIFLLLANLAGCTFIGGVFKTGVGVGAFLVIAILVIILMISRRRGV